MADGDPVQTATHLLKELNACQWRVMTVESCTGGLVSAILTNIPGCSHAFERGLVTYSNEAKHELAGVDPALIEEFGPVSSQVAQAMASGGLAASNAHLALALTGYADDNEGKDKAGIVYVAVAAADGTERWRLFDFASEQRDAVRNAAAHAAMQLALDILLEKNAA